MKIDKITVKYVIIVVIEIIIYLFIRDNIISFISSEEKKLAGIEVNLLSTLIDGFVVLMNIIIISILDFNIINILLPNPNKIAVVIENMKKWLFSAKVFWSPTIYGTNKRIANTIEGLFGFTYSLDKITDEDRVIIKRALNFISANASNKGLPSLSIKLNTVHCTAMGLYILQTLKEMNIGVFKKEDSLHLDELRNALIKSGVGLGWGFITEQIDDESEIRIPFSFWALRSLNKTIEYDSEIKPFIINTISNIIHRVPDLKFGFSLNDSPRICSVSLFLILIYEMEEKLKWTPNISKAKIKELLAFIIKSIQEEKFIEFEEYTVSNNKIGNIEKLSWFHISIGYALQVISVYYNELSFYQKLIVGRIVKKIQKHYISQSGCFTCKEIHCDSTNPYVFPTAYMLQGLYFYYLALRG